jgi:DNA-binding transcriptional LysR family regulator
MELRHLRYFVAVAEAGNLSRAAEKLFIAQPPLSLQIRQFEDEVGTALFSRHPKGMKLTPAGEALLPNVRDLLDRAASLVDAARKAPGSGTLTIGFVPSASSTVIPALARRLRVAQPGVELRLAEMISDEQHEALVAGRIDGGIARTGAQHPHVRSVCALADPFCLALHTKRAATLPDVVNLRGMAAEPFVAFTRHRGPAYFDRTIRLCGDAGFSPRIRYEASTLHGVLDLVGAELGMALVPASAALLGARDVVLRRLRQRSRGDMLTLLTRRREARPLLAGLAEAVESIFAEMRPRLAALNGSHEGRR